jgi:hypothetical protein
LTVLSEGAERSLVAELLQKASHCSQGKGEDDSREELADLLDYLKKFHLRKNSEELLQRMQRAEQNGDAVLWQELMRKKVEITRKLHGEQT